MTAVVEMHVTNVKRMKIIFAYIGLIAPSASEIQSANMRKQFCWKFRVRSQYWCLTPNPALMPNVMAAKFLVMLLPCRLESRQR